MRRWPTSGGHIGPAVGKGGKGELKEHEANNRSPYRAGGVETALP